MTDADSRIIALLAQILSSGGGGGGAGGLAAANNLSDVGSVPTSRSNLGVPAATVAGKYRIKSDGTFQLWNADTSKFHTLTLSGADGAVTLDIAAGES